jgi:hypothetical protein
MRPVVIARDGFPIDDARARAQAGQRIDDQREATGEIIARSAIEAPQPSPPPLNIDKLKEVMLLAYHDGDYDGDVAAVFARACLC